MAFVMADVMSQSGLMRSDEATALVDRLCACESTALAFNNSDVRDIDPVPCTAGHTHASLHAPNSLLGALVALGSAAAAWR